MRRDWLPKFYRANAVTCIGFLIIIAVAACTQRPEVVEVTRPVVVQVTATPEPQITQLAPTDLFLRPTEIAVVVEEAFLEPKGLVVCQVMEPDSLFLYSTRMLDKDNIHHAIYENLVTQLDYGYQAQGIEKLPSLEDGDVQLEIVTVQTGDTVLSAKDEVVVLMPGVELTTAEGENAVFDGTPLEMTQLIVDFTLKPMVWSDGVPVSAADSVFSYVVNQAVEVPFAQADNFRVERTESYEATGGLTLRWTGLPGWLDRTYFLNVWTPLPEHHLGQYDVDLLPELPDSARRPLSSGPFVVTAWQPGEQIQLAANPHYYRADEGLPYLDTVTFRFWPDSNEILTNLLAGQCDIAGQSGFNAGYAPFIMEAAQNGLLTAHLQPGLVFEHLAFGIDSLGTYGDGNGRPDWFEDVRVRQALTLCTDRQRIMIETMFGLSEIWDGYSSPAHPLQPAEMARWLYAVDSANDLLDEVGYLDSDGDGIREDPATATPFAIELITSLGGELRQQITAVVAENWRDCGVQVNEVGLAGSEIFADEGLLFGRPV